MKKTLFHPWNSFISKRAQPAEGTRLFTMNAKPGLFIQHRLLVKPGACPVSRNPIFGLATVSYTTYNRVVEVVSLQRALTWATTSLHEDAPRNVEDLAEWIRCQVSTAVGVTAEVKVFLVVRPGPQMYTVTCGGV